MKKMARHFLIMHRISKLCAVLALLATGGCSNTAAPSTATTTTPTQAVTPATTGLLVGQTQLYALTLGTSLNVVTWTSSNSGVLTIDATGLATGIANGVATVTGVSDDGSSATLTVQVVPVYQGSWAGTSTVIACTDVAGFALSNYCSQKQGATERWTLNLTQIGLALSGTMAKSEGANVLTGSVTGAIGASGDIISLTGTLVGFANGVNLALTPISWDALASGNTITGTWAANVTSPQILGIATIQWQLTGAIQ